MRTSGKLRPTLCRRNPLASDSDNPGPTIAFVAIELDMTDAIVTTTPASPAAVVQHQLDAYNAKDLDALVAVYADDAELYEFPSTLLARGSGALRERFAIRFQEPNLHAELLHRIVAGDKVIDHERITRDFPEGLGTLELTMIYEVKAGRIARAWSFAGPKTLRA